jgi:hypothetical protein
MYWCFPKGSSQVAFNNWWLPDGIIKVLPNHLLNMLDVNHLARGEVGLHEYSKLMDVMLQHVDVVTMGYKPSDSVISFWSLKLLPLCLILFAPQMVLALGKRRGWNVCLGSQYIICCLK